MRNRSVRFVLACIALAMTACSTGPGDEPADGGNADAASDAPSDSAPNESSDGEGGHARSDALAPCNGLTLEGAPTVPVEQIAADPPVAQGGTIADGKYLLSGVAIYTGAKGPSGSTGTGRTALEVTGTVLQVATDGQPTTRTVTLSTSGASFTSTDTCPDSAVVHGTYTATPTTLAVQLPGGVDDAGARTVVETFAKQ